jgi:hypothetical protein
MNYFLSKAGAKLRFFLVILKYFYSIKLININRYFLFDKKPSILIENPCPKPALNRGLI